MNISIGRSIIGDESPVFIIAELSANHNQKLEIALETVRAAKEAGADAIKLQHYTADTITIDSDNKYFQINQGTLWDGTTLYKLYQKAYMPWEWTEKIMEEAERCGLVCFSSPFDFTAVDFLEKFNVPAYKIASFEITDIPLIEYAASKGKPMIISTGIAEFNEIEEAIAACRRVGNNQISILKCTSAYPAPLEEMNLNLIPDMKEKLNVVIGLSDHSLGTAVPVAAVALGAKIIEKHFIIDKKLGGPDSEFSLEPDEFKTMVRSVRDIEKALGSVTYALSEKTKKSRTFSRSLFVVEDIKKGEIITEKNIRSIRPGYGLAPKYYKEVLGKKANVDLNRGLPLDLKDIE